MPDVLYPLEVRNDEFTREYINNNYTNCGGSIILSNVISDELIQYDFFGKCRHVIESGDAYIYDFDDIEYGYYTSELNINLEGNNEYLNSNKIIDYNGYTNNSDMVSSIGEHIGNTEDPCFYGVDIPSIINNIDDGHRYRFAVLCPMYYYYNVQNLYPNRKGRWVSALWQNALEDAVTNYGKTWDPNHQYIYITDYNDGYGPGNTYYHPMQVLDFPGLLYDCYKTCPDGSYMIKSLNASDNHSIYVVNRDTLELILSGVHYGFNSLTNGTDICVYIANIINNSQWFSDVQSSYSRINRYYHNTYSNDSNFSDKEATMHWLDDMKKVIIDNEYYNTNDEIFYLEQLPIFVIDLNNEYNEGYIDEYSELDLYEETTLTISKDWSETVNSINYQCVRPDTVYIDLYAFYHGILHWYACLEMTSENAVSSVNWQCEYVVPSYINGSIVTWYIKEREIPYYDNYMAYAGTAYIPIYDYSDTIDNETYGICRYINSKYSCQITNQVIKPGKFSNNVKINVIWEGCNDCESCDSIIELNFIYNQIVNSIEFNRHPIDTHYIQVPYDYICSATLILTDAPGEYTIIHSDNYLEWNVFIYCTDNEWIPIDDSEVGNVFYFEVDSDCYKYSSNANITGFEVAFKNKASNNGNGSDKDGHILETNNWGGAIYKICYHPVDFENYIPESSDYINWLKTGWRPLREKNDILDSGNNILAGQSYGGPQLAGFSSQEGIIVPYDGNIGGGSNKVRIYIARSTMVLTEKYSHCHDKPPKFKLRTLTSTKTEYAPLSDWGAAPSKDSLPIRCGGYLTSLIGLEMNGESLLSKPDSWREWCNRAPEFQVASIPLNGSGFDYETRTPYYTTTQPQWEDIHEKLDFDLNYDTPERFALGSINSVNDDNMVKVGGIFERIFENNVNLVDASNLLIPQAYADLMYFRTFRNTGLQFTDKQFSMLNTGMPYYDVKSTAPAKTFAPFKEMYRDCKYISTITDQDIQNKDGSFSGDGRLGMHFFDSMFSGCSSLNDMNISLPLSRYIPWGVCMKMFKNCPLTNYISSHLIDAACEGNPNNVGYYGYHAFRGMFSGSEIRPQILPEYLSDAPSFAFAYMYYGATGFDNNTYQLQNYTLWQGSYWGMFMYSNIQDVFIKSNSYKRWTFGKMFYNCIYLNTLKEEFNSWQAIHGQNYAHYQWVKNVTKSSNNTFNKKTGLPTLRGDNRIPKKWYVTSH